MGSAQHYQVEICPLAQRLKPTAFITTIHGHGLGELLNRFCMTGLSRSKLWTQVLRRLLEIVALHSGGSRIGRITWRWHVWRRHQRPSDDLLREEQLHDAALFIRRRKFEDGGNVGIFLIGVDALEQKLTAAGVPFSFDRYDAKHAFANEEADSKNLAYLKHDAQAAAKAWDKTLAFLHKNLA